MQQPRWKIGLSYLKEVVIERTQSIYNDELTVSLVKGQYQLSTQEAIYSYGLRYDNYFSAFKRLDLSKIGNEALILGLGLGSIPYMLERSFDVDFRYTAVEIDEAIIALASRYVLNGLRSEVSTIHADAINYMAQNELLYDLIAMDIFVSDYIPEVFETVEFLQQLRDTLSQTGLLLFNRLYYFEQDKLKTRRYFEEVFLAVFPNGTRLDINGNWILINDKTYLKPTS